MVAPVSTGRVVYGLPLKSSLRVGPAELAYLESGDPAGPTVVFLHGFPTHAFLWRHVIHLLGDAFSPTLIGRISDQTGSLQKAFWAAFAAAALSGLVLLYGARFAPRFKPEELRAAQP